MQALVTVLLLKIICVYAHFDDTGAPITLGYHGCNESTILQTHVVTDSNEINSVHNDTDVKVNDLYIDGAEHDDGFNVTGGGLQILLKLNDERMLHEGYDDEFENPDLFDEILTYEDDDGHYNITKFEPNFNQEHKTQIRVRREYVKMPSNKRFKITPPKPKYWSCKKSKSRLRSIKKYGRTRDEYKIIQKEMDKTIVSHPGYSFKRYNIVKIEKITNGCLWKQYRHRQNEVKAEARMVNQRMLFHGSVAIKQIVDEGFNEQYSNTNGMFGAGLYFAEHSSKANQYVFSPAYAGGCLLHSDLNCKICERKMLLARVILGKSKNVTKAHNFPHPPAGFHSVIGIPSSGGLKYAEYVVYRKEQAYPEYQITYKLAD